MTRSSAAPTTGRAATPQTRPPAPRRARDVAAFAAVTVAGAGAVSVLATLDPYQPGHYPGCPFLRATDLYCPGCGTLRAVHSLATGDPLAALDRNPLAVLLAPLLLVAWAAWGLRVSGRAHGWHPTRIPTGLIWVLAVTVVAFWVLRNIPGWSWLSPA